MSTAEAAEEAPARKRARSDDGDADDVLVDAEAEAAEHQAQLDENQRKIDYEKAGMYWDNVDATIDGVLGGFGHLTEVDLKDSHEFFQLQPALAERTPRPGTLACDCGAGIGRVAKGLLLDYCEKVDIVEQCKKYTDASWKYVGKEHIREVLTLGLQDFDPKPNTYDLIWVQWVIGHLPDEALVAFLKRCVASLKPGGLVGLKENNCRPKQITVLDDEDSSITRSDDEFRRLFAEAGLTVSHCATQTGFPAGMFAIQMYWLDPGAAAAGKEGGSGA